MLRKNLRQNIIQTLLRQNFAQPKKKIYKTSEDSNQKNQEMLQFETLSYRHKTNFNFMCNQSIPQNSTDVNIQGLNLRYIPDTALFKNIPKLAHGLNQYLKGQLVEHDAGLGQIPSDVPDEVFNQMSNYRSPKNDPQLIKLALEHKCKYFSSTSNISTALIQIYFMFSLFRRPNFTNIFQSCPDEPRIHMVSFRKPVTYILSKVSNNCYSIESDKGFLTAENEVLSKLGTVGEYILTHQKSEIKKMEQELIIAEQANYYRYAVANNNLFLRSQIDCRDQDQNGNPFVFQIKTRACAPIRYDVKNYQSYMDYPIDKKQGRFESFERQYYDLIRGGFLKYAFQLKIGRMDGAFIAYHNTKNIYGYEYVRLKQIIMRLFGDQFNFDSTFLIISKMLTDINDYILKDLSSYDCDQLKIGMYANSCNKSLIVMVQVMDKIKGYKVVTLPTATSFFDVANAIQMNQSIFRYQFNFYTFLNGTLYRQNDIYFQPNDQVDIKMSVHKQGQVHKIQYLSFLQEAYKAQSFYGNFRYNGMWGKY